MAETATIPRRVNTHLGPAYSGPTTPCRDNSGGHVAGRVTTTQARRATQSRNLEPLTRVNRYLGLGSQLADDRFMIFSPRLRLSWLVLLLGLGLASPPAFANRARATSTAKKTTVKQRARATQTRSAPRPTSKKITADFAALKAKGVVRVSDRVSITRADAAVISHLAAPLSLRGPKADRLSAADAKTKITKEWSITDSRIIANADPAKHPITGNATVVVAAQKAKKGAVAVTLGMKTKREFIVNISTAGDASVVGERSNSGPAKMLRLVNEKLAVGRIVTDLVTSSGVRRAGAGVGVLALAVLAGNSNMHEFATQLTQQFQMLGPIGITAATISVKNGMGRRATARLHAFEQLTAAFGRELSAGKSITVEAAYSRYSKALKEVRIGNQVTKNVQPPSREHFVKALAAWEAGRNIATN